MIPDFNSLTGRIRAITGRDLFDTAVVLGSGWGASSFPGTTELFSIPYSEKSKSNAEMPPGHSGMLHGLVLRTGRKLLVFSGRSHLYEGYSATEAVWPVSVAASFGCDICILTNASGATGADWPIGLPALIADHINLTSASPLTGATFIDMTSVYSPRLRELAKLRDPTLREGTYVQFRGPQYETPAEVRMAATLGGDFVGMSTVIEAIAARAAGMEVLGISLVTNLAAGVSTKPLNHQDVLRVGKAAKNRMNNLLAGIVHDL